MADLHTPADVATRLGKSANYWLRKARRKEVPHRRIGQSVMFTEADVEQILAASYVEPVDPLRSVTARSRRRS